MAYNPADLRLPAWLLRVLNALIRLNLPIAPRWHVGVTRAGALMLFSLLGLWAAALYSSNNLLYLCGGMLSAIAAMALLQSVLLLRQLPRLGAYLPSPLEAHNPMVVRRSIPTPLSAPAFIEAHWAESSTPIQLQINLKAEQLTLMARFNPTERDCIALSEQYIQTAAPLGLWRVIHRRSDPAQWLVLPTPMPWLEHQFLAQHAQHNRHEGDEFQDLRSYIAGDALSRIHWRKSTLASNTWRIKRFAQSQQPTSHADQLRVDLRQPSYSSRSDFERLLGMAWFWLKQQPTDSNRACIIGQLHFQLNQPSQRSAAMQVLAAAQAESQPPLAGEGLLLSLMVSDA